MRTNERLLAILSTLGADSVPVTLTEVADRVDLPKSTTLRFLRSLEPEGWVVRDSDGKYGLGPAVVTLAAQYLSTDPVLVAAPRIMRGLRDEFGETVSLSRILGHERTCVLEVPSRESLRLLLGVGSVGPLHAGGSGLVLLAHVPEEFRQEVYESSLHRYTDKTITKPEELETTCAEIREKGWCITYGQKTTGGVSVAVAVRDPRAPGGVSALGIFGPQARFDPDEDGERRVEVLLQQAAELERIAASGHVEASD